MTLRLIVVRHAKSSWDDPLDDHDRPLSRRGRHAALVVGRWLAREGHRPGLALVSDALRTRETWARIAGAFDPAPPSRLLPGLYHAGCGRVLDLVQAEAEGSVTLVLGHNPGLATFVAGLLADPPRHRQFARYPTGATTIIDLPATAWSEIAWGSGSCAAFAVPREIED